MARRCSARGTSPTAKRANGDADAAIAIFTECAEMARRKGFRVVEMVACNAVGEIWEERGVL